MKVKIVEQAKKSGSVFHSGCQADLMDSLKQSVAATQYSQELVEDQTLDQTEPSPVTSKKKKVKVDELRKKELQEKEQELREKVQELKEKDEEARGLRIKLS